MKKKCLERAIQTHDRHVVATGHAIWLGSEPTFTDRNSQAPEWLSEALGEDKERRARQLLGLLRKQEPGAVVLRTVGRQYAGEPVPRWSYGIYTRRDGASLWAGPPDWLEDRLTHPPPAKTSVADFGDALCQALCQRTWPARRVQCTGHAMRVVFRCDGTEPASDAKADPRLLRTCIHAQAAPADGSVDALAASGEHLLVLSRFAASDGGSVTCIELPAFSNVEHFCAFLNVLSTAALGAGVERLTLCGFPPPVDETVAWTTLTPDPAVLEVNHAPASDLESQLHWIRQLYALAEQVGLSPFRLAFDGTVSDSGGGGQVTFGGPTPLSSPFFAAPQLLPRLLRYLVRHPSLSYWFATHYVGGSSQSPRPDEGSRDAFSELELALDELSRVQSPTPDLLWGTLRHFLADGSGNPHRSELNIEKLYNPYLYGRGCLGLVEFRALRMAASAERSVAQAFLFRSIIAMLMDHDVVPELVDWRDALHDRFALPSELRGDLDAVFGDLNAHGWELGAEVEQLLSTSDERRLGSFELGEASLEVEQALEFWPLVGDAASQESGGSRLVDSSTHRIEVRLSVPEAMLSGCELTVADYRIPLRRRRSLERVSAQATCNMGIRFRAFVPFLGLHPTIAPVPHVDIVLSHRPTSRRRRARLHLWKPDGCAYDGLPQSWTEAEQRRRERFVVEQEAPTSERVRELPKSAVTEYCVDLRRARAL